MQCNLQHERLSQYLCIQKHHPTFADIVKVKQRFHFLFVSVGSTGSTTAAPEISVGRDDGQGRQRLH